MAQMVNQKASRELDSKGIMIRLVHSLEKYDDTLTVTGLSSIISTEEVCNGLPHPMNIQHMM